MIFGKDRDQDRIYGDVALRRIRVMGIRDKPIGLVHLGRTALPNG
jgi:hypothetical protein